MSKTFNYKAQYAVIVTAVDEQDQQRIYEQLKEQGLTLKIVVV